MVALMVVVVVVVEQAVEVVVVVTLELVWVEKNVVQHCPSSLEVSMRHQCGECWEWSSPHPVRWNR